MENFSPDKRVEKEGSTLIKNGYIVHLACFTNKNESLVDSYKNITIHRKPILEFLHKTSVGAFKFPFYFNF